MKIIFLLSLILLSLNSFADIEEQETMGEEPVSEEIMDEEAPVEDPMDEETPMEAE